MQNWGGVAWKNQKALKKWNQIKPFLSFPELFSERRFKSI
tara:strand:- start:386 stop:505 length:120 start_codon:yes stop_codon:yes gene_type:complete